MLAKSPKANSVLPGEPDTGAPRRYWADVPCLALALTLGLTGCGTTAPPVPLTGPAAQAAPGAAGPAAAPPAATQPMERFGLAPGTSPFAHAINGRKLQPIGLDPGAGSTGATAGVSTGTATGAPAQGAPAAGPNPYAYGAASQGPFVDTNGSPYAPPPVAGPFPARVGPRLIPFASTRLTGGLGGFDLYVYDPAVGTVYSLPGTSTAASEIHPRLSANGRFLVFASNVLGNFQIFKYDMVAQSIDPLWSINDPVLDQVSPSIDDSGTHIAYLTRMGGLTQLRMADVVSGAVVAPPQVAALGPQILTPQISADGRWTVFSALTPMGTDIYAYQLGASAATQLPFVNTAANEIDPCLSPDGLRVLYASDRSGTGYRIYETDMASGLTDNLALANGPGDAVQPRYLDADTRSVYFQSNRTGLDRIYLFHGVGGALDTMPLLAEPGEDAILGDGPAAAGPTAAASTGLAVGIGGFYNYSGGVF